MPNTSFVFILISQAVLELKCDGESALMLAAKNGHTEIVQELIQAGADVKSKKRVLTIITILTLKLIPKYQPCFLSFDLVVFV